MAGTHTSHIVFSYLSATLQATVKYNNSPHFDCIDITLKYFKLQVIFEANVQILYL